MVILKTNTTKRTKIKSRMFELIFLAAIILPLSYLYKEYLKPDIYVTWAEAFPTFDLDTIMICLNVVEIIFGVCYGTLLYKLSKRAILILALEYASQFSEIRVEYFDGTSMRLELFKTVKRNMP
jgi:hypothetical protein